MTLDHADPYVDRPDTIAPLEECQFYHWIDLPGFGEMRGDWDLRDSALAYLGDFDFQGKRALDVGTASGFLTFEMEKRGADVVSFDMKSGRQWDVVPYREIMDDLEGYRSRQELHMQKIRNSYWLSHHSLNSNARAYFGNIYEPLPKQLGTFDVAVFGMIFTHLRDPFGALASMLQSVTGSVIVTNHYLEHDAPTALFVPSKSNNARQAFWMPSKQCVTRMLEVLGFRVDRMVDSHPACTVPGYMAQPCTAIVASRVR